MRIDHPNIVFWPPLKPRPGHNPILPVLSRADEVTD